MVYKSQTFIFLTGECQQQNIYSVHHPCRRNVATSGVGLKQNKTKQNKTKQNKTKQNKTKQNKTKQNKTKQNKTKQNKTKQNKTKQNKTKQNKNNKTAALAKISHKMVNPKELAGNAKEDEERSSCVILNDVDDVLFPLK